MTKLTIVEARTLTKLQKQPIPKTEPLFTIRLFKADGTECNYPGYQPQVAYFDIDRRLYAFFNNTTIIFEGYDGSATRARSFDKSGKLLSIMEVIVDKRDRKFTLQFDKGSIRIG